VIKDKLKQVVTTVQGSHITDSPLVHLILLKNFVVSKHISPEACWLERLAPGQQHTAYRQDREQ